jgi:hypothetical protein
VIESYGRRGALSPNRSDSDRKPGAGSAPRGYLERLGPYQSLALLLVPAGLVEPMKLVAVAVVGEGHWLTGTGMIVAAYAASIFFLERLFKRVKPKLLTLPWFARLWKWFVSLRGKLARRFERWLAALRPEA